MICPRCLNEDDEYFYYGSKGWMCRRCVSFKRVLIEEELQSDNPIEISEGSYEYSLDYPLTFFQKEIAQRCADNIDHNDVLIEAICGARQDGISDDDYQ